MGDAGSSQQDGTSTECRWPSWRSRAPPPALCPAPPLSPLTSLLAVGPPLLTLVNFEVENLAYMLVCMQWMVSGGPARVPWAYSCGGRTWGVRGQPLATSANRCACDGAVGVCTRAGGVSVCLCVVAGGERAYARGVLWVSHGGVSSLGLGIHWAPSARHLSSRQGFPQPAPLHSTFTSTVSPLRLAGQGSYPLTGLRHPGPERGGDVPSRVTQLPFPAASRPLPSSSLLYRTCSGPPASTPASSFPTFPSTVFLGRCSSLWLSGMAGFGMAGCGELTHRRQGPLTSALHVPICRTGTVLSPWAVEWQDPGGGRPQGSGPGGVPRLE